MSQPKEKKKKKKIKIPPGPTRQRPTLSLLCSASPRATRVARRRPSSASAPRAVHRRVPCRPFTLSSPLPLSTPDLPRSPPQTLTLSTIAAAAELRPRRRFTGSGERRRDSSLGELPCAVILRFWPSPGPLSLPAGPATSASVRRRLAPSCRSAAAAPRPPRCPPFPLWPRPVAPLRAAAARRRRARACARAARRARRRGRAHAAVKAGLALTRLGGPLARGPRLSAPGLAGWGCT